MSQHWQASTSIPLHQTQHIDPDHHVTSSFKPELAEIPFDERAIHHVSQPQFQPDGPMLYLDYYTVSLLTYTAAFITTLRHTNYFHPHYG
jgi:hypothetical protein